MLGVACPRIRFSRLVIATLLAALALSASARTADAHPAGCEVGPPTVTGGGGIIDASFINNSNSGLTFKEVKGLEGEFIDQSPPCQIGIGETVGIISIQNELLHGTEFALVYELDNHSTMRMTYQDPEFDENNFSDFVPAGYALHAAFNKHGGEANFSVRFTQGCECDGIPDEWKEEGVYIDPATGTAVSSGTPGAQFIDLPHMGVSLDRPNVLVQMDWMEDSTHNQKLKQASIDKVIEAYNNDPVTYSGATRSGITLIVDA